MATSFFRGLGRRTRSQLVEAKYALPRNPLSSSIYRALRRGRMSGKYRIRRYRRIGYRPRRRWRRRRNRCAWMFKKEMHYADTNNWAGQDCDTVGAIQELTAIAQGDGVGDRTGNKIVMRSIYLKGYLALDAADTTFDGRMVRMVVVRWNEDTDLTAWTDIFDAQTVSSKVKMQNENKFKILWDHTWNMRKHDSNAQVLRYPVKFYKRQCYPVIYQNSTSTSGYKGRVYVLVIGNYTGASDPVAHVWARVKWQDV